MIKEAYNLSEAGRRSGRSEKAMRQLRAKGTGPRFHKLGGRVIVFADDLQAWLESAEPIEISS